MWGTRVRDHDFERQMGELNVEAGNARERAANLEAETIKLKIAAAWRRISKEQHDLIVSSLKGQNFELWVSGVRAENDQEANNLWQDIVETLKDTDLKLVPNTRYASAQGVSINPVIGPNRDSVKAAFAKAGIELFDSRGESQSFSHLEIVIGSKLPPN
jgi:hypothetical protein